MLPIRVKYWDCIRPSGSIRAFDERRERASFAEYLEGVVDIGKNFSDVGGGVCVCVFFLKPSFDDNEDVVDARPE